MWRNVLQTIKAVLSLATFAFVLLCAALLADPFQLSSLPDSDVRVTHQYYLYDHSSCAQMRNRLSFREWLWLEGESVTLSFVGEEQAAEYVERLLHRAGVQIVAKETCMDAHSTYMYVPNGGAGMRLFGGVVNLHVVRRGRFVSVGAPIIFGGY